MKKWIFISALIGVVLLLGVGGCQSVNITYDEGVVPLPELRVAPELQELFNNLDKAPSIEHEKLVNQWKSWLGEREVPLKEKNRYTFVLYNNDKELISVGLEAHFNGYSDKDLLYRYKTTGLYYKTYTSENPGIDRYRYTLKFTSRRMTTRDSFNSFVDPGETSYSLGKRSLEFGRIMKTDESGHELLIYLPPEYFKTTQRRFGVLYVLDGQNIWDSNLLPRGGWKLNSTAERLVKEKKIPPLIIVGIPSTKSRSEEYLGMSAYYKSPAQGKESEIANSKLQAQNFLVALTEKVIPWVDGNLRTLPDRENRSIAGASFGGSGALWLAMSRADLFSRVGSLSGGNYTPEATPAAWKTKPFRMLPYLTDQLKPEHKSLKIYLDVGTEGTDKDFYSENQTFYRGLLRLGFQDPGNVLFYEDKGGTHNEVSWARRIPKMLEYLFSQSKE